MFGWINDCTECLVLSKFGEDTWHEIKEKASCNVDDGGFLRYKYYDDSDTVKLIVAASEVLETSVDAVLDSFGHYFVQYVEENGYANVLECLGSNLRDWLSNLNSLHDHLQASYPDGFVAPVFWSEDDVEHDLLKEGAESNAILVHYFSHRGSLLVPMVVGLIKEIAHAYFDIDIVMQQIQLQNEDKGIGHTSWRVTTVDPMESHKLRGKKAKPQAKGNSLSESGDDATVMTHATTRTNYEPTFREGGAQAAMLRVEELVKRSFQNEDCELYHALTSEHYLYLVHKWIQTDDGRPSCYELWALQEGDTSSWPLLSDLPSRLNPCTIDPLYFGGKVPTTGQFPPDDSGALQSFPPHVIVMNKATQKLVKINVLKSENVSLHDAILEDESVVGLGIKDFKEFEDCLRSGDCEIQCQIWDEKGNSSFHTFCLKDLQTTSTLQLFELVPNHFDPIRLVLECVETIKVDENEEDI